MIKYKHALALNPYFGDSTALIGVFPPTGLEYIAASMRDVVGKVTLLDLRYEKAYQEPKALSKFIRDEIDLLCISIRWNARFVETSQPYCVSVTSTSSETTFFTSLEIGTGNRYAYCPA